MRILCAVGVFATVLFFVAVLTPVCNYAGGYFVVGDSVQPSGAIVVLAAGMWKGGVLDDESLRRTIRGIELFKNNLAPIIVFSGKETEEDPLVAFTAVGEESGAQLDNAGSIFLRLFEEGFGAFDIGQIATDGSVSDTAKLVQALDGLDSIPGNVTMVNTVDGPVFTVHIRKSLNAFVNLDIHANALLGEVELSGPVEIRADVELNIVFAFDSAGFYVMPDLTPGHSEMKLSHFVVDGAVEASGRLGFLGVDLKEAIFDLGQIVGRSVSDDILDRIFENFCIGK